MTSPRTPLPEAYRLLIADVYELAGLSRRSSEAIAREHGQTVARWHALSVFSGDPLTVAAGARRLGLARQSVQRVVDGLIADGLLAASTNPDHKTAPLIGITDAGTATLARLVTSADADRDARLGATSLSAPQLDEARRTVRSVIDALDG